MQRAEIITVERRRRWSLSDKQQIVAETLKPGASVSTIAQRYGMHPSHLFAGARRRGMAALVEGQHHRVLLISSLRRSNTRELVHNLGEAFLKSSMAPSAWA
jgi:transposase